MDNNSQNNSLNQNELYSRLAIIRYLDLCTAIKNKRSDTGQKPNQKELEDVFISLGQLQTISDLRLTKDPELIKLIQELIDNRSQLLQLTK
ncbi:hypothetical protein KJZ61_00700 [Candidatus Dependentiae bacterium]|nr:hypothetical protein [Candidatus Dependentiae bacterium]